MKKLYYYLFLLLVMVTGTACDDKKSEGQAVLGRQ